MPIAARWRKFFGVFRPWLPAALEIIASITSFRVAILLLDDPTYFGRHQDGFQFLMDHLTNKEWVYGLFVGFAALFKMIGVAISVLSDNESAEDAGFIVRSAGWAFSMLFWGIVCISTTLGAPNNLASIFTGAFAALSLIALLGPTLPAGLSNGR